MRLKTLLAIALAALLGLGAPAGAQAPKTADAKAAPTPAPQLRMPDAEGILMLIRTTLITLDDAVATGNFTVLRDRGAPGFREANSAARLGVIFANLAQQGLELGAVSILAPKLDQAPTIDPQSGLLRIKGHFPGDRIRVDFEFLFQAMGARWRLFGLAVQPVAVAAEAAAPAKGAAPKAEEPASGTKAAAGKAKATSK
jgi:hypothetical protein